MKKFLFGTLVVFTLTSATWGLDGQKMAALEKEWGPVMETNEAAALQSLEATLGSSWVKGDLSTKLKAGIVAHNLGRALPGKGWPSKAADRLKPVAQGADPELAVIATVYQGSATALMANEDLNPAMKILLVNQGWDLLTEGVNRGAEASFLPRFLRASVGQSLPEFFGKAPTVVSDTRALETWATAHPGRVGPELLAQIVLMEANALKKTKDLDGAVAAWKRVVVLDPQAKGPAKAAQAALELYDE